MAFQVTSIIDGNTFTVSPRWKWKNIKGDIVKASGYEIPAGGKPGHKNSKGRLSTLVLGKTVVLKKVEECKYGCLFCNVYVEGKNLTSFFTEFKNNPVG